MKIQYLFLPLLFLSSCSSEIEHNIDSDSTIEKIHVNLEDFKNEEGSRTNITTDAGGVHYVWAKTDTIGIFPSEGKQVEFPMSEGAGSQSATFSGGGWGLKQSSTYAAYCPLIGQYYLDKTKIPVDYTSQVQDGNNSTAHLGKYDYLAAPASGVENGTVSFNFKRLGCVVRLEIPIQEPGDVTSVKLSCDQPIFIEQGTFNLNSSSPQITSENLSKTFSIELKNVTTTTPKEKAVVYFMTPPLQMTGKVVKATVINNGVEYIGTVQSKDMAVGTAYKLPVTMEEKKPIQNVYHVATAGTLPQLIGEENKFKITELKLTGELNGTDIRFLREMAGRDVDDFPTLGQLKKLDLYSVSIVTGGERYYQDYSVQAYEINGICSYMFYNCNSLENIVLPKETAYIRYAAFNGTGLTSINLPLCLKGIGEYAFQGCPLVGDLNIPEGVTYISNESFSGCDLLRKLILPNSLQTISGGAFHGCSGLPGCLKIPDNVYYLGEDAFSFCSNFTSLKLSLNLKTIANRAFSYCNKLTGELVINEKLKNIGDDAFKGCHFTKIIIKSNREILQENACSSIEACEELHLTHSLKQIRDNSLPGRINVVYSYAIDPPIISQSYYLPTIGEIFVPKSSVDKYKAADGWKDHAANIFEMPEGVTEP